MLALRGECGPPSSRGQQRERPQRLWWRRRQPSSLPGVWAAFKLAYFAPAAAGVMGGLARPRGHPMLRYAEADLAISSSFYVLS
jgi:hypothetical protein